ARLQPGRGPDDDPAVARLHRAAAGAARAVPGADRPGEERPAGDPRPGPVAPAAAGADRRHRLQPGLRPGGVAEGAPGLEAGDPEGPAAPRGQGARREEAVSAGPEKRQGPRCCWGTVSRPCPRPRPQVSRLQEETFG